MRQSFRDKLHSFARTYARLKRLPQQRAKFARRWTH
jgi:hypothetical protein